MCFFLLFDWNFDFLLSHYSPLWRIVDESARCLGCRRCRLRNCWLLFSRARTAMRFTNSHHYLTRSFHVHSLLTASLNLCMHMHWLRAESPDSCMLCCCECLGKVQSVGRSRMPNPPRLLCSLIVAATHSSSHSLSHWTTAMRRRCLEKSKQWET